MNAPSELHELLVDIARRENAHIADVLAARNGRADEVERLQAENAQLRQRCTTAEARGTLLEFALGGCVKIIEDSLSDSEGRYPYPDGGCIDCTLGTVPSHLSTGPCAYHEAKRLLSPATGETR